MDEQTVDAVIDGKYRLERCLGEGGTGIVYEAFHLGLGKRFALKLLTLPGGPESRAFQRFRREAETLGRLEHPGIVAVTDFGVDPTSGRPYLVMERLQGPTLAEELKHKGRFPPGRALALLECLASAVDHAHTSGVLHRDLKPGNVVLAEGADGRPAPRILDFGLAAWAAEPLEADADTGDGEVAPRRAGAERLTHAGALIGTPTHIAPELIREPGASRAADVYSFGVMAYEVLVGRPPFEGTTSEVLSGHLSQTPPDPASLGVALAPEVTQPLMRLLEKDPSRRPPSASDAVEAMRRGHQVAEGRRWRSAEIPRRLGLAALVAVLAQVGALLLAASPPGMALTRWLVDRRFATAPRRPPDRRILLISVDEATLAADARPLTERADEVGSELERVFEAGARAIAIDFLLPARWSTSRPFSDLVIRHPEELTLAAAASSSRSDLVGSECVAGLITAALGPARAAGLFGLVNLDEDPDGVVRRARASFQDRSGSQRDSFARRAARAFSGTRMDAAGPGFWIDRTVEWRDFDKVVWRDLPSVLATEPQRFRDRVVLVGGDFVGSGDDSHRIATNADPVSGLVLQALIVDTIVSRRWVRDAVSWPWSVAAILAAAAVGGAILLGLSARIPTMAAVAVTLVHVVGVFWAFERWRILLPVVEPVSVLLIGSAAALILHRKLPGPPDGTRSIS